MKPHTILDVYVSGKAGQSMQLTELAELERTSLCNESAPLSAPNTWTKIEIAEGLIDTLCKMPLIERGYVITRWNYYFPSARAKWQLGNEAFWPDGSYRSPIENRHFS